MSAFVHPTADVADTATVGDGTKVWHQAQLMPGARVGRECTLGKGAFLSGTAVLGDRVKVGNNANIMGAAVGDGAFVGPQAYLMEDRRPRAVNPDGSRREHGQWRSEPVTVGPGATVGGGALVLPGVSVGAWAMVSAGAVVHRDVPAFGLVGGNPARQLGWVCRCAEHLDETLTCSCGRRYRLTDASLLEAVPG
jgi:UDP-2-acetamido-3-amino-2,3-dideoxy-glucuronate N-acetyltransferase